MRGPERASPDEEVLSEVMLRQLAATTSDLLTVIDAEARIRWASPSWQRVMGHDPARLVGTDGFGLVHPDDVGAARASFARLTAEGSVHSLLRVRHADGSWRWHDVVGYVLPAGGPPGIVTVARDVTEQKEAAQRLRASEERLRAILQQSPISTQIVAPEGRTVEANPAFYALWGITPDVIADYNLLKDPQLERKGILPHILRALAGEAARVPPVLYDPAEIGKPGRPRWVRAVVYPVKGPGGEVREVVIQHEDITDQRHAEDELREANERLRQADEARARFVNMAAHELKTPMTPLRLQIVLLKADQEHLSDRQRAALDVLERNVDRLDRLVEDVLDAVRLQAGRLRIDRAPLDLNDVVAEALDTFREVARGSGVALTSRPGPSLPVDGDARRLAQVVFNVLSNALKATPAGGRIEVESGRDDGQAVVRVRDSGIGLRPEDLAALFLPFSQVEHAREAGKAGTGLGLFISKGIIEEHGGRIAAESAGPGKGATFSFTLPLTSAALPKEPRPARPRGAAAEAPLARRLREAL